MLRKGRKVQRAVPELWASAEGQPPSPEEEYAQARVQPTVDAAELERVALQVVGVYRCRVLLARDRTLPERVRLMVQGSRRLAAAKDVQSAWFALWGLYVPRGRFVVTAVRSPRDLESGEGRLRFLRCALTRDPDHVRAEVHLTRGDRLWVGQAEQVAGSADQVRLAATAALQALRVAVPGGYLCEVVEVRRLRVAGVALLCCAVQEPRGDLLFGVAPVHGDEPSAAVCAVLDATNRRLTARLGGVLRSADHA